MRLDILLLLFYLYATKDAVHIIFILNSGQNLLIYKKKDLFVPSKSSKSKQNQFRDEASQNNSTQLTQHVGTYLLPMSLDVVV